MFFFFWTLGALSHCLSTIFCWNYSLRSIIWPSHRTVYDIKKKNTLNNILVRLEFEQLYLIWHTAFRANWHGYIESGLKNPKFVDTNKTKNKTKAKMELILVIFFRCLHSLFFTVEINQSERYKRYSLYR